ncbi:RNA polymerase sigma factor [Ideonella livida]|uniref:RNA polymerase sigma factor n=1 Tax=Ideonella livida TaxID=2707176 RepID=A0A7C9TMJ6_9BURK|nr:sigma-70 family RNA polymerase sigma factor [Ideonella livida]NDY94081.1 sigma-70 family RNA polymerase sigma factor [Ideonella livida]
MSLTELEPSASARLAAWLDAAARGDRQAFMAVYDATHRHLYGLALRMMGRADAAEDVLQEAFVKVWHHAAQFDPARAQPMTWLIHIVRHQAIDQLRRLRTEAGRTRALDESDLELPDVDGLRPEQALDEGLRRLHLDQCMGGLSPSQRQALALTYFKGWPHQDIAQAMGVPLSTAKSWVRRGLEQLRQCLARLGVGALA